jgi:hypothetical protein
MKTWKETIPPSLWFNKSKQNLKFENPQDNAEKPYVHEFGFMAENEKKEKEHVEI